MNGPLFKLLVSLGVPAAVAAAIVAAVAMLAGCAGESVVLTRSPNTVPAPTAVVVPSTVPQK